MSPLVLTVVLIALAVLAGFGYRARGRHRRRQIAARPLPEEWHAIVERNVPLYQRIPEQFKPELHGHIQLFLHDKQFFGFQGQEITDEIRVTVAANACILLLNRHADEFSGFKSIYIYPSTFLVEHETWDGRVRNVAPQARLGESWHRGPLVLAWDAALHGTRDMRDGHNVILHEFAHKLDGADGAVDGAPLLHQRSQYTSWARVMSREYKDLRRHAKQRAKTVMDHYGATQPEEFFAVLVETFFEKPRQLQDKHPELYDEMQRCFGVDTVEWHDPAHDR